MPNNEYTIEFNGLIPDKLEGKNKLVFDISE